MTKITFTRAANDTLYLHGLTTRAFTWLKAFTCTLTLLRHYAKQVLKHGIRVGRHRFLKPHVPYDDCLTPTDRVQASVQNSVLIVYKGRLKKIVKKGWLKYILSSFKTFQTMLCVDNHEKALEGAFSVIVRSFAALTLTLLWDNIHSMTEPNHDIDDEECDDGAAQQGDHTSPQERSSHGKLHKTSDIIFHFYLPS